MPDLAYDFSGSQVAIKTLRTGRTERAIQRTSNLRRDAQRAAPARRNKHGFDSLPRATREQPLYGAVF